MGSADSRYAGRAWAAAKRRISRHPRWWAAGSAILLLVLGILAIGATHGSRETAVVRKGDLVTTVIVTGTLNAVHANFLGPPAVAHMWRFSIARIAPEGTVVKKGASVLVFDTSSLLSKLKEKRAESEEAAKKIEKQKAEQQLREEDGRFKQAQAEANLRKVEMLLTVPPALKAANDLKKTRLDLRAAKAEVTSLKASLDASMQADRAALSALKKTEEHTSRRVREIKDALKRMNVKAPRTGTVIYQADWNGKKKAVGDACWVGEKIMEVADLRKMKAEGEVNEVDSGKVAPGQRVVLRLDASPDVAYTGRIRSVWGALQVKSPANPLKVIKLDITLDRTDTRHMMPGMRFTGTIETGIVKNALIVPAEAVAASPSGPEVLKRTLFGWRKTAVKIGKRTGTEVQVLSGLSAGERILDKWQGEAAR